MCVLCDSEITNAPRWGSSRRFAFMRDARYRIAGANKYYQISGAHLFTKHFRNNEAKLCRHCSQHFSYNMKQTMRRTCVLYFQILVILRIRISKPSFDYTYILYWKSYVNRMKIYYLCVQPHILFSYIYWGWQYPEILCRILADCSAMCCNLITAYITFEQSHSV